ncbi:MAG: leucyl aminopeptidase family protein [Xanthomonadales bacterium]|nr:leucyl aminopeptidase family protein [Xanthomonadales bacterium]
MSLHPALTPVSDALALPVHLLAPADLPDWRESQPESVRRWLDALGVAPKAGSWQALPAADGQLAGVLVQGFAQDPYALAPLALALPAGTALRLANPVDATTEARLALGFALGAYQYTRYRPALARSPAQLAVSPAIAAEASRLASAVGFARDLVHTPTEDCGPAELQATIEQLGAAHGATVRSIVGDALLAERFPAIHAVGRASHRAPRLVELDWGNPAHPAVTVVGKGVCFDTGGLDIKPADGMLWMKKDMGGAAVAIALARLVMERGLKLRLKLLVPTVENAIGPDAYRPGEVIRTRAGFRVEIGNTDAEGRVILCDALSYAAESRPELLLDFATLTGAARIALGPDLPATFSNRDGLSDALIHAGRRVADPLWPMPLPPEYQRYLDSPIADFNNAGATRMGGAITAALYLQRFVPDAVPWAHLDTYCWNDADRPGRPRGGECQGLRAADALLTARYG